MNTKNTSPHLIYPNEPNRFTLAHLEPLLEYCVKQNASDIIFQTSEPVMIDIYGQLHKITRRRLTNTEVGELLNGMYGPNGTTQILTGSDVDTNYEIRPTRIDRFRFRVNGTGCQVEGHAGIQVTLRTIPNEPPRLAELNLPEAVLEAVAPTDGVVYVTGATGSGKSTLLAAIIRNIAEDPLGNRKILTYESPIEFVFDAIDKPSSVISQSEIPRNLPSFAIGVRNALRRTPRLILVGEARDIETMSAVSTRRCMQMV
jgi:defect in organelle trafficking protein DotB